MKGAALLSIWKMGALREPDDNATLTVIITG